MRETWAHLGTCFCYSRSTQTLRALVVWMPPSTLGACDEMNLMSAWKEKGEHLVALFFLCRRHAYFPEVKKGTG